MFWLGGMFFIGVVAAPLVRAIDPREPVLVLHLQLRARALYDLRDVAMPSALN